MPVDKTKDSSLMAKIRIDSDHSKVHEPVERTAESSKINPTALSLSQNSQQTRAPETIASKDGSNFDFSKIPRKGVVCGGQPVIQNTAAGQPKALKMRSSSSTTEIIGGHSFTQTNPN